MSRVLAALVACTLGCSYTQTALPLGPSCSLTLPRIDVFYAITAGVLGVAMLALSATPSTHHDDTVMHDLAGPIGWVFLGSAVGFGLSAHHGYSEERACVESR